METLLELKKEEKRAYSFSESELQEQAREAVLSADSFFYFLSLSSHKPVSDDTFIFFLDKNIAAIKEKLLGKDDLSKEENFFLINLLSKLNQEKEAYQELESVSFSSQIKRKEDTDAWRLHKKFQSGFITKA